MSCLGLFHECYTRKCCKFLDSHSFQLGHYHLSCQLTQNHTDEKRKEIVVECNNDLLEKKAKSGRPLGTLREIVKIELTLELQKKEGGRNSFKRKIDR